MTTASMARLLTVTASTKRNPPPVGGKIGAPALNLAGLPITPLMPISAEIASHFQIESPRESKQCFADGAPDVREGDLLVVSGVEYPVQFVEEWPHPGGVAMTLIVVHQVK